MINVIRKGLQRKDFYVDGYKYTFLEVKLDNEYGHYFLKVNCELPTSGQAYILQKMNDDVEDIVHNLSNYVGAISYRLELLVNGNSPLDIFIPYENLEEILVGVNESINRIGLPSGVSFETEFTYSPNKPYYTDDTNVDFQFYFKIFNIKYKDEPAKIKKELFDDFAGYIQEYVSDFDRVRMKIEDIIYATLEPYVRIRNHDGIYYNAYFILVEIEGENVDKINWNSPTDNTSDFFI